MKTSSDTSEKLVLFDIDHTLVDGSEGHKLAFTEGFRKVYGLDTKIDIIDYLGMTDKEIIFEVLKKLGLDERTIDSKLEDCINVMVDTFERVADRYNITILDGVRELLIELQRHNLLVGLVTGNIESIAWRKLRMVGLERYFKLGGFGNEDIKRSNLIKIAVKKAQREFNFIRDNNVFVFGDTPRDMYAGNKAAVKTVGVATGRYSEELLRESGADYTVKDLKDTNRILEIIYPQNI